MVFFLFSNQRIDFIYHEWSFILYDKGIKIFLGLVCERVCYIGKRLKTINSITTISIRP